MYPFATGLSSDSAAHHLNLSRQIHHRNLHGRVAGHRLQSEASCIASHIEDIAASFAEQYLQCLGERVVTIIVVECEPAFPDSLRQMRQSLIDCLPFSEMFQSGRFAFPYGIFEPEHTYVIDIVVEIHVDLYHLVVQQEPSCLGTEEPAFAAKKYPHRQG